MTFHGSRSLGHIYNMFYTVAAFLLVQIGVVSVFICYIVDYNTVP